MMFVIHHGCAIHFVRFHAVCSMFVVSNCLWELEGNYGSVETRMSESLNEIIEVTRSKRFEGRRSIGTEEIRSCVLLVLIIVN